MRFIVLTFLLIGCGTQERYDLNRDYNWASELRAGVNEFITHMDIDNDAILTLGTVALRDPPDPDNRRAVGICFKYSNGVEVYIDPKLDESERRFTLIHELGHCLLNLHHDSRSIVMSPEATGAKALDLPSRELLYHELETLVGKQK